MQHRLYVSYDLQDPTRNEAAIQKAIEQLSVGVMKIHRSLWRVQTDRGCWQMHEGLKHLLNPKDRLIVIDPKQDHAVREAGGAVLFMPTHRHEA